MSRTALLTLEAFERRPGRTIACIGLAFAVAYLLALTMVPRASGRILNGDAVQYYAYLRSLAIDGDLDFTNEYLRLYTSGSDTAATGNVWISSSTPVGRRTNQMSIGPAILWSPFFAATWALLAMLRPFGVSVPLDGFAAPFQLSAGVAGVAYAAIGAWFCVRACRALVPDAPAFWGSLVAWLASPVIYYSLVSPAYSHAPSMMTCAIFCDVWLRTRRETRATRYVWLGLLAGLAALVRWQDIVFLGLPGVELLAALGAGRIGIGAAMRAVAVMATAAVAMLVPQMLAWNAIYGSFLVQPQGPGFMRWTEPALVQMLFSLRHGLFSWTPALALAVAGWWALCRRDTVVGAAVILVFLVTLYVNASVIDWWAGEAFGARRFAGNTVLFALGFASLFATRFWQARPVLLRWTTTLLIVYNLLFLLQYQLFMHGAVVLAPYPETFQQVFVDRLTLPWRLLSAVL